MGASACTKDMNNLLNNPNYPLPENADVDLYLNTVQLNFNEFYIDASDYGAQLSRQQFWPGPQYVNAYQPSSFDDEWTKAYTGVISNAKSMIPLAMSESKFIQAGIAQVLMSYTIGTLVDDFGDVPFSMADLGAANTNPTVDKGAAVYASLQSLLDSAILNFKNPNAQPVPSDLFYNGNASNWVALANTLKLKFYMQTRLVDNTVVPKIQALVTSNNLINSSSQDFVFHYSSSMSPDSRHPHYATDYINGGGGEYLSNYFMCKVTAQKWGGTPTILNNNTSLAGDPRVRYYFYREVLDDANFSQTSVPCYFVPAPPAWYVNVPVATPFCYVGGGFFGRDYGDNSGTSPDQPFRTTWGVYPMGGQFDANQAATVSLGYGAGGAGINPIWLSSFTEFLLAEASLTLGIDAGASTGTLLKNGINASIAKVIAFPASIGYTVPSNYVPTATQINNYVNLVINKFNSATPAQQLDIIMSEYYIAAWGNGIETYNNIRRTGSPTDVQVPVTTPTPGFFMYSFFYPSVFVNRNINAPAQKTPGTGVNKVFWDNNPNNFVK